MFKPVSMAKIAIMGLRKNQQTAVSVLHDMEILQLAPLSKEVSAIVKNEKKIHNYSGFKTILIQEILWPMLK